MNAITRAERAKLDGPTVTFTLDGKEVEARAGETILDVAKRGGGTTICAFYDGAIGPYISYIEKFRPEFEALIRT